MHRSVGLDRLRIRVEDPLLAFETDKLEKDMDMKDVADAWRLPSSALKSKRDGKVMGERGDEIILVEIRYSGRR